MGILFESSHKQRKISCVLYDVKDSAHPVVEKFLALDSCERISFYGEDELGRVISEVKTRHHSKETVILKEFKGRFFQVCPKTPQMICCNYRLVNAGFGCFYDCTYCYLQSYLNSFGILLFTNTEDIFTEFENFINSRDKKTVYRIGTGEFTDSLMLDDVYGIGKTLVEKAACHEGIMIELKTKSANIDHLLPIEKKGNAVVAFSLNSISNAEKYEDGAAAVSDRIDAAADAVRSGYLAAFHFDPIIYSSGWAAEYKEVLEMIADKIPAHRIAWISMGCFRYSAPFRDIMRKNHPGEELSLGELFPSRDGKFRYPHRMRRDIYTEFSRMITETVGDVYMYMCMESDDMWKDVFDKDYAVSEDLEADFSLAMRTRFFNSK